MDSGELDFYQHDRVCSNTCRSTKIDLSGARASLGSPTPTEYIPLTPATADGRYHMLGSLHCWLLAWGLQSTWLSLLGPSGLRPPPPSSPRKSSCIAVLPTGKSEGLYFLKPFLLK